MTGKHIKYDLDALREMVEVEHLHQAEIAKRLGCGQTSVSRLIKRHGLKQARRRSNYWRGGRIVNALGYVRIHKPDHPMAGDGGYVAEHRYVMAEHLGRVLGPKEIVHHIDHDTGNNSIENLKLLAGAKEHSLEHPSPTGSKAPQWRGGKAMSRLRKKYFG